MSRQPINILAFPYFVNDEKKIEYAIFKRADCGFWQGISGGVESEETIFETVKREVFEEAGILVNENIIKLDSIASIKANVFNHKWDKSVFVVTEYSFGIEVMNKNIRLSHEHSDYKWLSYDEAVKYLKHDSNKTALWELNERILRK